MYISKHSKNSESSLDRIKRLYEKLKCNKRYVGVALFLTISVISAVFSACICGVRFGYTLQYSGKTVAQVENKSEYLSAVEKAAAVVDGKNVKSALSEPRFVFGLINRKNVPEKNELSQLIIENSERVVEGYKAVLNGEEYIYPCSDKNDEVENYLLSFNIETAENSNSYFTENLDVKKGYFLLSDTNCGSLSGLLSTVPVKTVAIESADKITDYKTVTVKTDELVKGDVKVKTAGSCGITRVDRRVTYLNGVKTGSTVVKNTVLKKAEDRIILEGTAESKNEAKYKEKAHKLNFVFPIEGSCRIGDGFGAGRNHKGCDLLAPGGTKICAVKAGKVIRSGWYSGYGLCVDIDHGNGIVTRYGHESALCKKVGDTVSAGEVIGLVGQTGNAIGNHTHFEVIINGQRVDPTPFLRID